MRSRSRATQTTAMSTMDKEAQCCTIRLRCVQDGTQTDPTTMCSASCQTEASFPGVDVFKAGVSRRKSFHRKKSADKHNDEQNAAKQPVRTTKNSFQAQEAIRPEKECYRAYHFGSQSNADEASLGSRGREHTEQETESLNVCQEHFPRGQELVAHREMPHSCKVCEKCFSQEGELVEHARMHTGEKRYSRHFSHECYTSKHSLDVHEKTRSGDPKPYVCKVCQKHFSTTHRLVAHWKLHTGETLPHSCTVCAKQFSSKRDLFKHAREHATEKHYCRFCQQRFTTKQSLDVHERTCSGELSSFICYVCEERLSTKASLVDHIRAHAGDRPFGCSICPAHFRLKNQLALHMKAHAEGKAKTYICPNCQETFARRCDLSAHIRQHTVPAPVQNCRACGKHFVDGESRRNHERRVHTSAEDRTYACFVCHKTFDQVSGLASHYCPQVSKRIFAAAAQADPLGDPS